MPVLDPFAGFLRSKRELLKGLCGGLRFPGSCFSAREAWLRSATLGRVALISPGAGAIGWQVVHHGLLRVRNVIMPLEREAVLLG